MVIKKERRIRHREWLPLSVRVEVRVNEESVWAEETIIKDVSDLGAGFRMSRPVPVGQVVFLTLPMPRQLRRYDHDFGDYNVWGVARKCIEIGKLRSDPEYAVGIAFIGKKPPPRYFKDSGWIFDLSPRMPRGNEFWSVAISEDLSRSNGRNIERRQYSRIMIPEELIIELIDEEGAVLAFEATVTENIGRGGAAVFTTLEAEVGSFARVTSESRRLSIISIIKEKRRGPDGVNRFHLEFVDKLFPLDGLE